MSGVDNLIELYSGTPGSGKSLHLAENIYYAIRRGNVVVGNVPINCRKIPSRKGGYYIYLDNCEISPEKLVSIGLDNVRRLGRKEDSLLLIIDECQILFNSRDWQSGGRADWLTFFTQHRKYNYRIILVAQFDGMIDKQIRSLIEYNVIHRKVSNFGKVGKFFSVFFLCKLFVAVKIWYPLNERLEGQFFRYRKKYASLYDTYSIFVNPNN